MDDHGRGLGGASFADAVLLSDGELRSGSPFALRLDPPVDHEGRPDRRWYLGLNRSVASDVPSRAGRGLAWVEICVR